MTMNKDAEIAWHQLSELGFRSRVVDEPGEAGGERTTYHCLGSFAFRVHVELEPPPGAPPVWIIVQHVEWDKENRNAFMSDRLDHHDLSLMARALPALALLAGIGRASAGSVLREIKQ